MSDAAQAVVGMSFAPKTLIPVSVGRTTVNLYPVVNTTMLVHERAHAFQINKTALSSQALELSIIQALDGSHQRHTLQLMLKAAQQAEDDFTSMQRIARDAIGLSQAFPVIGHATGSNQALALPSQAKTTLSWYSPRRGRLTKSAAGQGTRTARPLACYGCEGPHPWLEYQQGSYVIIFPNQNNPGIKEMRLELWSG